jgi:hypothetical protein
MTPGIPHPFDFLDKLVWLDGRPLVATVEPYRRAIFESVLYGFERDGRPRVNFVLCGRAKKNWKTSDLILAALYRFLVWPSPQGNDCFILANDEGQAADDLTLAKKLIAANPILDREVVVKEKQVIRRDARGALQILPAGDVAGAHGKTYLFIGFDEIHGYRNHDLFEALAPDPTRPDVLTWVTSYAGIRHAPGIPLYDFMQAGKRGDDPRMLFSWYGGDFGTDPAFADLPTPEERANPSMASWRDDGYLAQQRLRLPTHKYRRLHLNLPGAPEGAALSGEHVMAAIVLGRKHLPHDPKQRYMGFVDMSGGSSDDAVLGIAHKDESAQRAVLDALVSQTGAPPFNPRHAVQKFVGVLKDYRVHRVVGDAYAGQTFRQDFEAAGVGYEVSEHTKSAIYEAFEPKLNAYEVELLDHGKLQEQLLTLVWRGVKIDHLPGDHDDFANAAAGALMLTVTDSDPGLWKMLARNTRAEEEAARAAALTAAPQRELIAANAQRRQLLATAAALGARPVSEIIQPGEKLVRVEVPKGTFVSDGPRRVLLLPGVQEVPERIAHDWFARASGVAIVEEAEA